MKAFLTFASLLSAGFAFSQEKLPEGHPCKKLADTCKSAGYEPGHHKKDHKGLHIDCMQKIMKGEAVEGVTVDAADVTACKAKREERQKKK